MMDKLFELLREKGKCCISEKPLKDSAHLTMVALDFPAAWQYPVMANVFHQIVMRAVAFVHDDCIVAGKLTGKIKYAVEFNNGDIIYHDVPEIRRCRVCGCYDLDACVHEKHGNCYWVENDLCSHCKFYPGQAKRYSVIIHEEEKKKTEKLIERHKHLWN